MRPSGHVEVERWGGDPSVACLTLNRPQVGNAMSSETLREIAARFAGFAREKDLRAVVVRGAGRHFCSGADIEWMRRAGRLRPAAGRKDAVLLVEMCRAVQDCPVPVIARVQGAIYGGGLGLVSACDIVLAEEGSRMCFSECRLGIVPAVISCFVIPKIGTAAARRYYLTAEAFGMAEALRLGLVHEVSPEAELDARLETLIGSILRNGPNAVREAKALLLKLPGLSFKKRVDLVLGVLTRLRGSPEGQEGLSAFLEKRPPSWAAGSTPLRRAAPRR